MKRSAQNDVPAPRIRDLRRRRGWTQRQLAEVAGVSERTVQRIENGAAAAAETKLALAAALDASCAELDEKPRTMFPVNDATLRALLGRAKAIGVGAMPPVARDVVSDVEQALARRDLRVTRRLARAGLHLLAAELDGGAAGFLIAPVGGAYTALFRTR